VFLAGVGSVAALDDLRRLRRKLVEARRKAAAEGARPGSDEVQAARSIQALQERIEAIDRAIADEEKLAVEPSAAAEAGIRSVVPLPR